MATTQNITLKRYNGTDWDSLYPKTIPSQVVGLIDYTTEKISLNLLPDSLFGGLTYYGSITAGANAATTGANILNTLLDNGADWDYYTSTSASKKAKGRYLIATAVTSLPEPTSTFTITINSATKYATLSPTAGYYDEEDTGVLEVGDWLIFNGLSEGTGTQADPYVYSISIVNNTYQEANSSSKGVVKLASSSSLTSAMTGVVPTAAQVVGFVTGQGYITSAVTSITLKAGTGISLDTDNTAITTTGTRTISLATSGVTAGTYKSVTVDTYGRVTGGSNPTTIAGYGITDAKITSGTIILGSASITPLTDAGTSTLAGSIIPASNKGGQLNFGSSTYKFNEIYATSFIGNLTGSADKATDAYYLIDGSDDKMAKGSSSVPVYFNNGVPVAVSSIATSLLSEASASTRGTMSANHYKMMVGLATMGTTAPSSPVTGEIYFATN